METRRRGRSFLEESPPPSPSREKDQEEEEEEEGRDEGGPVMYDPSLVFDEEEEEEEEESTELESGRESEEDEEEYFSRGRSRSRSVHCNDESDGKLKGLSEEELTAQLEQTAKNQEKSQKPAVVRTGALKQREVDALNMGLQQATHQTKEEERLEEQAEKEAAQREKEERSVSINNPSGRGSLQQHATPLGLDPPMRRVKILLLGDSSVGKSSLIHRITDNTFKHSLVSTVGVDYKVRKLHINGENIQVQLWDTAGSEKFHKITQSYYRGVNGIMLVFDVSNRKSFRHVSYWLSNITKYANENVQVQLVGNKVDLRPESMNNTGKLNKFRLRKSKSEKSAGDNAEEEEDKNPFVQTCEGSAVASKYQIKYTETSALNDTNIEESLTQCVKQVIHQIDNPTLISSLRDKIQKRDSKPRLSSGESKVRTNSAEKKALASPEDKKEKTTDASTAKKGKESSKDKDCIIS